MHWRNLDFFFALTWGFISTEFIADTTPWLNEHEITTERAATAIRKRYVWKFETHIWRHCCCCCKPSIRWGQGKCERKSGKKELTNFFYLTHVCKHFLLPCSTLAQRLNKENCLAPLKTEYFIKFISNRIIIKL